MEEQTAGTNVYNRHVTGHKIGYGVKVVIMMYKTCNNIRFLKPLQTLHNVCSGFIYLAFRSRCSILIMRKYWTLQTTYGC